MANGDEGHPVYSDDRMEALSNLGEMHMAQRVAIIAHLLDETPAPLR